MKIPKTLKISGFTWNIKYSTEITKDDNVYGTTHHATQTIFLDPNLPQQQMEQVFLHELMHVVFWHYGLTRMVDDKQEEIIINAASMGLYDALSRNGLLK